MRNYKLQNFLFFGAIATILIVVSIFVLNEYFKMINKSRYSPSAKIETNQEQGSLPYSEREWLTYTDDQFHYVIKYPSGLRVLPIPVNSSSTTIKQGRLTENGGVSFASLGPGVMGVKVYTNTSFKVIGDWLVFENQRKEQTQQVVEKRISIDGYEALVTYSKAGAPPYEESFPNEKKTVFIKDGILFEIWTNFYDDTSNHKRVWESFRFVE